MLMLVCWLPGAAASATPECGDCLPAPVQRPYRREPEETAVAIAALVHHFKGHPVPAGERACVTLPGHRPPTRKARGALAAAGVRLDPDADCRFEEGRVLWSADGVWRVTPTEFVAQVTKSEFGDVSLFLEGYEYTLRAVDGGWAINKERASPCNPSEGAKGAPATEVR
jgi:hypothetical protein